jgi:hypothetical protein
MILILNHDRDFNLYNNKQFIRLKDACDIKKLEDGQYTVLMLDTEINNEGIIEELSMFFEELIISVNVVAVITTKASEKLREICNFHNISLLEI